MNHSTTVLPYSDNELAGLEKGQQAKPLAISFRLLLALYAVIPIAALVILIDTFFLHSHLKSSLPKSPYDWWIISAIFNYPHIFASQFSLLDREYIPTYRRLLLAIPLVVLLGLLLALSGKPIGFLIFELLTIYHVIMQQIGINRMMMRKADNSFNLWKWLFLAAFALAYAGLVMKADFIFFVVTVGPLLIPTTYLAYKIIKNSQPGIGRHYLCANQTMLLSVAACFSVGYPVFSVLIPRAVHDLSAFVFYIDHDTNRNRVETKNGLYRIFSILPISAGILCPLLAVNINLLLQTFTRLLANPFFYIPITMIHYHTERVIWRGQNIHRKSLAFRP
ncbi:MAG: hypothetical protein GTO40_13410 [Deltaproteobacteria bacterium]|nr:hypothetical protein [Deltaproteobacteria bacterium]